MFSILLYAIASFYYVLNNFPSAANMAIGFAKTVPLIQASPVIPQLEKQLQTVVLPSTSLQIAVSGALSLLAYPFVMLINEVVQFFIYWLALFGFLYLSISQKPEWLQAVCGYVTQAIQMLKAAAPERFQSMLALPDQATAVVSDKLKKKE